jgi:hypothetical protein
MEKMWKKKIDDMEGLQFLDSDEYNFFIPPQSKTFRDIHAPRAMQSNKHKKKKKGRCLCEVYQEILHLPQIMFGFAADPGAPQRQQGAMSLFFFYSFSFLGCIYIWLMIQAQDEFHRRIDGRALRR